MNINAPELGTFILTNAQNGLIVGDNSGIGKFSLQCTSSTPIEIKGTRKANLPLEAGGTADLSSVSIPLEENAIFDWGQDSGIKQITIYIPVGASAKLAVL